jgi:HSF-type DNA-binding
MIPNALSSSMAALLQQAQQRQQLAVLMAGGNNNSTSSIQPPVNVLPSALEEEVGRRKAVIAGTPYSITKQFPFRLHEMLDLVEEEGLEEIVSFLPDGRSFKVHDPARFEKGLMRRCFNQTVSSIRWVLCVIPLRA